MSTRSIDQDQILQTYGMPGTAWSTQEGQDLLLKVIERLGFRALSDEAVKMLAQAHQRKDQGR